MTTSRNLSSLKVLMHIFLKVHMTEIVFVVFLFLCVAYMNATTITKFPYRFSFADFDSFKKPEMSLPLWYTGTSIRRLEDYYVTTKTTILGFFNFLLFG